MAGQTDIYRACTRDEFEIAVRWAAAEGWNPGRDDADIFWETDPGGFVCIERDGEVIGTGSLVSYGSFGFMGFFIVREDLRRQGIGAPFWSWRRKKLAERMEPGSAIGMDGVFDMQAFYARGGFEFSHRNLRMEGRGRQSNLDPTLVDLLDVPFERVAELDRSCFGFDRRRFLQRWIRPRGGRALARWSDDELRGFGVVRRCESGFKIGPLFAGDAESADCLFAGLAGAAEGEPVVLDVPECNPEALALAARHGLVEVFGCARMYAGAAPPLPWGSVYGITTFELG